MLFNLSYCGTLFKDCPRGRTLHIAPILPVLLNYLVPRTTYCTAHHDSLHNHDYIEYELKSKKMKRSFKRSSLLF